MSDELKPGDRVQTPLNNFGTIQPPPYDLPLYHMVKLDTGVTIWMRRDILEPCSAPAAAQPTPAKKRRSRKSA